MKTLDLTPTWAGLMPGLIACLQSGQGQGPAIAASELTRLAHSVDSANEAARAAAAAGPFYAAAWGAAGGPVVYRFDTEARRAAWLEGGPDRGQIGAAGLPDMGPDSGAWEAMTRPVLSFPGNAFFRPYPGKAPAALAAADQAKPERAAAALDLARAAEDFRAAGAFMRAACYYAAAARIAPAADSDRRAWLDSADLMEREAAGLLSRGFEAARREAAQEAREKAAADLKGQGPADLAQWLADLTSGKEAPAIDATLAGQIGAAMRAGIPVYWIEPGAVSDPEGPAPLGTLEYQFSDGPAGFRSYSNDFLNLAEGLAAIGPALYIPAADLAKPEKGAGA